MRENKCEPSFNSKNLAKLDSLFKFVTDFSFIATLVISCQITSYQ